MVVSLHAHPSPCLTWPPRRLCCEHATLAKAAAATSADAAAAALSRDGGARKRASRRAGSGAAAGEAEAEAATEGAAASALGIDIQAPCVEEIVLLQVCVCVRVCVQECAYLLMHALGCLYVCVCVVVHLHVCKRFMTTHAHLSCAWCSRMCVHKELPHLAHKPACPACAAVLYPHTFSCLFVPSHAQPGPTPCVPPA